MGEQGGGEGRGVDSTTKGSETRLFASTFNICLSDGCARHVYDSSMLIRHAQRVPDRELPRGYPPAIVHR